MTISRIKKSTTQSAAVNSGVKNESRSALVGVDVGDEDASEIGKRGGGGGGGRRTF